MAKLIIGEIEGIYPGEKFKDRKALRNSRLHRVLVGGIDGNGRQGAGSIVLNGGYVDDADYGERIIYTGHGGNDPNSGKQISDQSWEGYGNKALIFNEIKGFPVRVIRGSKHNSVYAPEEGYEYAGLYRVVRHYEDIGKDGFKICRFDLESIEEPNNVVRDVIEPDDGLPPRKETNTLRIVRDTKITIQLKELYEYTCQICLTQISLRNIKYAEAAHIRPLGRPHNGKDNFENLLCLCPNHHVMLDKGIIAIDDDLNVIGTEYELYVHKDHKLDIDNIRYQRNHIYIND